MAKYCRSDKCQPTVVKELRQMGARVSIVSPFKLGYDLVVGMYKEVGLFELKNTDKDKLTTNEKIFFQDWRGYVHRAKSSTEIASIMSAIAAGKRF